MDIHHYKVFRAAARASSFTAAGQEVSLSQSTVSLHIKQMEDELGCRLFNRSRKQVTLTEAGRTLQAHVDRIFAEIKNAELAISEFSVSRRGTIRLGVGDTTLIYLLPKVLAHYRARYPLIEIVITTAVTETLLQNLLASTIDIAIVMSPAESLASVQAVPLMTEQLVIVLAEDHPLAAKDKLLPEDLASLPFISHLRGTAFRTVQQDYFRQLGVEPRVVMELENIEAIKGLVGIGMGAAMLPLCSITPPHGHGLVYRQVEGLSMVRNLFIAAVDWKNHPPATRRLARHIARSLGNIDPQVEFLGQLDAANHPD